MEKKQVMDKGIIVGIDIGRYEVQMSTLTARAEQAETISTHMGEEKYEIPLCLFKEPDSQNWYYGEKAKQNIYSKQGIYIEDLWEGALGHREIVLEDDMYSYDRLMGIYLERLLTLLCKTGHTQKILALVFTTAHVDAEKIRLLKQIAAQLPVDFNRIFIVDYIESFAAYATRAKKDLWNHEVFLFYYTERSLRAFELYVNQKTLPFQILAGERDLGEVEYCREELQDSEEARVNMDQWFLSAAQGLFARKVISSVYLIGDGFEPGWMKESLRMLCRGRRVFQGNNLFTKGACYAGEWYLKLVKPSGEYKSSQLLNCDIRIPIMSRNRETDYLYAGRKGEPWYHAGIETELIQGSSEEETIPELAVEVLSHDGLHAKAVQRTEVLELSGLPSRPARACRLRVRVDFCDEYTGRLMAEDLGMGEFYPPADLIWEKEFQIKEKETNERMDGMS